MPPAIAIAGAAVVGAGASLAAGSKAANAQKNAANMQVAESRRQYDQDRADLAPWRQTGQNALDILARTYGINGQAPDTSLFTQSPGYQFRLNEGLKATERAASSRGLLNSGTAKKALMRYGEGLASQEFGDWWNRLAGVAGVGQSATNQTVQAGQNNTNNILQAYGNAGNARASSYANTGGAVQDLSRNVLQAYLYSRSGAPNAWGVSGSDGIY